MKIDAIITWVDGNDPLLSAKRARYSTGSDSKRKDVAGSTRFANIGEIFWNVASLNRFAPWLNKIWIVTDGQDPHLEPFIEKHFPDGHIPMEVVDHKVIFKGYEQYLPTFNSRSLETMIWRIPGLSEHFIELNDDFMLCAPLSPEDLFTPDGRQVCYARLMPMFYAKLVTWLKPRKNGKKVATFKRSLLTSVKVAGCHPFFLLRVNHTPRPLLRSFYEKFYEEHPQYLDLNLKYKFRNPCQYTPKEVQFHLQWKAGKLKVVPYKKVLFYMEPKPGKDYILHKIEKLRSGNYKFCCFNSLDQASEPDRRLVEDWIWQRLGIERRDESPNVGPM